MIPATIKRGASYRRVLIVREGDASDASVRSVLKTASGVRVQGDAAEEMAVFDVAWVDYWDGDPASPPGWILSLTDVQTAALRHGDYVMDARIELPNGVVMTETEAVQVIQRVTEPAGG
jgi:hypothetical protein